MRSAGCAWIEASLQRSATASRRVPANSSGRRARSAGAMRASCSRVFSVRRGPPPRGRSRSPPQRQRTASHRASGQDRSGRAHHLELQDAEIRRQRELRSAAPRPGERHRRHRRGARLRREPTRMPAGDHPAPGHLRIGVRAGVNHRLRELLQTPRIRCRPARRPDPGAQRIGAARRGQPAQRRHGQGVPIGGALGIRAAERLEKLLRLRRVARAAGDRGGARRPAGAHPRQHFVAQVVAVAARVGIAVVLEPGEALPLRPRGKLGARAPQQRPGRKPAAKRVSGGIAAMPARPAPRSNCSNTVSS